MDFVPMFSKRKKNTLPPIFWGVLFLSFQLVGCAGLVPRPTNLARIPLVRVKIISDSPSLQIASKGTLILEHGSRPILKLKGKSPVTISVSPAGKIVLEEAGGQMIVNADSLKIESPRGKTIAVSGKPYRGALWLFRNPTGNFSVVNELDLESYVRGVVPVEIGKGNRHILEALKAQAVAARTYAYRKISQNRGALEATVSDQVYGGAGVETSWTNRAVEATLGEILTYEGEPIYAFYSSTCGGRTEPVVDVWPKIRAPYLKGVADNFDQVDFCHASPHYRWVELWSGSELDSLLRAGLSANGAYNPTWGRLTDIRVQRRFQSGRIRDLEIDFQYGKTVLHGNSLRWLLKPSNRPLLRSTLCRFVTYKNAGELQAVLVVGAGNGHGVGMCQWGTMGMARAGYSYSQILGHYYRGAHLKRVY